MKKEMKNFLFFEKKTFDQKNLTKKILKKYMRWKDKRARNPNLLFLWRDLKKKKFQNFLFQFIFFFFFGLWGKMMKNDENFFIFQNVINKRYLKKEGLLIFVSF